MPGDHVHARMEAAEAMPEPSASIPAAPVDQPEANDADPDAVTGTGTNGFDEAPDPERAMAPMIREYPRRPMAATFEVQATSALVWVYAPEPTEARIEVEYAGPYRPGLDRGYARVSTHELSLTEATGRTEVREIDGLASDGAYRHRVQFGNGDGTDWHYFRTAPAADADAPVHFVFGADVSADPKYDSPLFTSMSRSGAAFFLSLGDWPYTDLPIRDTKLEQYRASHRLTRLHADTRRLLQAMPVYAIYDDHEVHNDWNRVFVDKQRKRALAALQAWDEFFPVRDRTEDPLARRRYRTWQWGRHAQFFMLDTRLYRSPHKDPIGPDKTLLGREQWDWLLAGLRASRASFKIILTSVPMDLGTTREHWNAYPHERAALYGFIADQRISGVVFLTGDQHWLAVHALPSGHRQYQVGPLRAFLRKPPEPAPAGVLVQLARPNYGEIVIAPGPTPSLVFSARDRDGALLYTDVIRPARGQRPPDSDAASDPAGGARDE